MHCMHTLSLQDLWRCDQLLILITNRYLQSFTISHFSVSWKFLQTCLGFVSRYPLGYIFAPLDWRISYHFGWSIRRSSIEHAVIHQFHFSPCFYVIRDDFLYLKIFNYDWTEIQVFRVSSDSPSTGSLKRRGWLVNIRKVIMTQMEFIVFFRFKSIRRFAWHY